MQPRLLAVGAFILWEFLARGKSLRRKLGQGLLPSGGRVPQNAATNLDQARGLGWPPYLPGLFSAPFYAWLQDGRLSVRRRCDWLMLLTVAAGSDCGQWADDSPDPAAAPIPAKPAKPNGSSDHSIPCVGIKNLAMVV